MNRLCIRKEMGRKSKGKERDMDAGWVELIKADKERGAVGGRGLQPAERILYRVLLGTLGTEGSSLVPGEVYASY
jgi:hypothetical protein